MILAPSNSKTALVNAIAQASALGEPLQLMTGTHLTQPGRRQKIRIGANGLRLEAVPTATPSSLPVIQRPDTAIKLAQPDDNYGLSFVPAAPTDIESTALQWQQDADGQFAILIRGDVSIDGLVIDCNMQHQGLESLPVHAAIHSAMIRFIGETYPGDHGPVYVAFRSVTLTNIKTINGGRADNIWFSRGEFNPNIGRVRIERLTEPSRWKKTRSTIAFSGLAQNVVIRDADIYSLELEETSKITYRQRRRPTPEFTRSSWTLERINAERIDLAANGKVYRVAAKNLTTTTDFQLHQAAGQITDSTLAVKSGAHRLNRLDHFKFADVTWALRIGPGTVLRGIRPNSYQGDPCSVEFLRNAFQVTGAATSGQVIDSELSPNKNLHNRVIVSLRQCTYPDDFGRTAQMPIANVQERGHWTFTELDFGNRTRAMAVHQRLDPDITVEYL
jgi:hypothetical protein